MNYPDKEAQITSAIAEYLGFIHREKALQIKENLKYDLEFRQEFRDTIFSLSGLLACIMKNLNVQDLVNEVLKKGTPKYQDTKDMQLFYLDSDAIVEDLVVKLSEEKSIIKNKLDAIKDIINRPALYDSLQGLDEKCAAKQTKI